MADHHQHHHTASPEIAINSESNGYHLLNNDINVKASSGNNIIVTPSSGTLDNNTTHIREHHHETNHSHHGNGETRDAAMVVKSGPAINAPVINWDIGLFDCGYFKESLYPCLCPFLSSAHSRSLFDGSPFIFNLFCVGTVPTRYLIRTAYGIKGSALDDTLKSIFCSCCSANQLYQTVKRKGKPDDYSTLKYNYFEAHDNDGACGDYCKAIVCFQCYSASALEMSVGLPFLLGFLCMNPCSARNIVRYHYRIDGHDVIEECMLPACLFVLLIASFGCGFPCGVCCVLPPLLETVVKTKSEAVYRERSELLGSKEKVYITGFYTTTKLLAEHNKRLIERGLEPWDYNGSGSSASKSKLKKQASFKDSLKEALDDGYKTVKKSKSPHKTQPLPEDIKPSDIAKEKDHHHHHHKHKSHSHDSDKDHHSHKEKSHSHDSNRHHRSDKHKSHNHDGDQHHHNKDNNPES